MAQAIRWLQASKEALLEHEIEAVALAQQCGGIGITQCGSECRRVLQEALEAPHQGIALAPEPTATFAHQLGPVLRCQIGRSGIKIQRPGLLLLRIVFRGLLGAVDGGSAPALEAAYGQA